jgi:hypothetical protein
LQAKQLDNTIKKTGHNDKVPDAEAEPIIQYGIVFSPAIEDGPDKGTGQSEGNAHTNFHPLLRVIAISIRYLRSRRDMKKMGIEKKSSRPIGNVKVPYYKISARYYAQEAPGPQEDAIEQKEETEGYSLPPGPVGAKGCGKFHAVGLTLRYIKYPKR